MAAADASHSAPAGLLRRLASSAWTRAAVTVALLGVVAQRVDWSLAGDRIANGDWRWFALGVVLLLGAIALGALRWALLLRGANVDVPAASVARIYVVSTFANNFLPTSMGGDVASALCVARRGPMLTRTIVSIVVDRIAALAGLVALAWFCYAVS